MIRLEHETERRNRKQKNQKERLADRKEKEPDGDCEWPVGELLTLRQLHRTPGTYPGQNLI